MQPSRIRVPPGPPVPTTWCQQATDVRYAVQTVSLQSTAFGTVTASGIQATLRLVNQNPGLVLLFGLLLTKVRVELHTGMCCQSLHIAAEWPSIGPFDSSLGLLWASRPTQPHAHQV